MKGSHFIHGKLKFKNDNNNKTFQEIQKKYLNEKRYYFNKSNQNKINEKEKKNIKIKINTEQFLQRKKERKDEENYYTPAEKLFFEKRNIILQRKFEKLAQTSYKEKYKNYNKALTKLPQHNDIPKIGPG